MSVNILLPDTQASPLVGSYMPVSNEKNVVLPAPFGPSNPNISPLFKHSVKLSNYFLPFDNDDEYTLLKSSTISG